MKVKIDKTLYHTRPEDDRLPKEMAVYDLLEELEIPFTRLDHQVTATIEDCEDVDLLLGIHLCKNLFLCNGNKSEYYLLMMPGEKKFKTKEISQQIGSSRLSFGSPEAMEEFLDITPGSVSILGVMNDSQGRVQVLVDEEILQEEFLGCHPCINTSSLKIKTRDILEKFLPYTGHSYKIVRL